MNIMTLSKKRENYKNSLPTSIVLALYNSRNTKLLQQTILASETHSDSELNLTTGPYSTFNSDRFRISYSKTTRYLQSFSPTAIWTHIQSNGHADTQSVQQPCGHTQSVQQPCGHTINKQAYEHNMHATARDEDAGTMRLG